MPKPENMEGYKRKMRWQTVAVLVFMFILAAGAGFQRLMLLNYTETPPGVIIQDPVPSDFNYEEKEYASGTSIHVFAAGRRADDSQPVILILGGWSDVSPVLSYEPLTSRLYEQARVVIPERPGHGWSGSWYSERTLDNMLSETRGALEQSGETGPYVIVAHTTAGLEAIRFAGEYPDDVAGIVFINALAPAAYSYRMDGVIDYIRGYSYQVPKHTGIFRIISLFAPQLFAPGDNFLNVDSYASIYCRNVMSPAMLAERAELSKNAKAALAYNIYDVPVRAFVDTKSYNANPELNRVWSEFHYTVGAEVTEIDNAANIHITGPRRLAAEILKLT